MPDQAQPVYLDGKLIGYTTDGKTMTPVAEADRVPPGSIETDEGVIPLEVAQRHARSRIGKPRQPEPPELFSLGGLKQQVKGAGEALGEGIVGTGKLLLGLSKAHVSPQASNEFASSLIQPQIEEFKKGAETPGVAGIAHYGAGLLPFAGPMAATAGESIGRGEFGRGLVESAFAIGTGKGLAKGARGVRAAAENILEPRRITKGIGQVGESLGIPASEEAAALNRPSAPEAISDAKALQVAKSDLAVIDRSMPVSGKGSAATFSRAKNVLDYAKNLWKQAHEQPIARNQHLPIGPDAIERAGMAELTPEAIQADPAGARAAQRWLTGVSGTRTLSSADKLLREVNADLDSPRAQQSYGPLLLRTKNAVAKTLRSEIERTLVNAGETGVRGANIRWGSLQRVAENMINSGLEEARASARAPAIPSWVHAYTFVHPSPSGLAMSAGLGFRPSGLFARKPSGLLGKGMSKLGKSSLFPPPIVTPGRPPIAGLLQVPPTPMGPGPDTSFVRAVPGEYGRPPSLLGAASERRSASSVQGPPSDLLKVIEAKLKAGSLTDFERNTLVRQWEDLTGRTYSPQGSRRSSFEPPRPSAESSASPLGSTPSTPAPTIKRPPSVKAARVGLESGEATPDRRALIGRGAHGQVIVEFPDAFHKDLFSQVGRSHKQMRGTPGIPPDIERIAGKLGVDRRQAWKIAEDYRTKVLAAIKDKEEGTTYVAPRISEEF